MMISLRRLSLFHAFFSSLSFLFHICFSSCKFKVKYLSVYTRKVYTCSPSSFSFSSFSFPTLMCTQWLFIFFLFRLVSITIRTTLYFFVRSGARLLRRGWCNQSHYIPLSTGHQLDIMHLSSFVTDVFSL